MGKLDRYRNYVDRPAITSITSTFMVTCRVLLSQKVHTPDAAQPTQSVLNKLASDDIPNNKGEGKEEARGAGPPITKLNQGTYVKTVDFHDIDACSPPRPRPLHFL